MLGKTHFTIGMAAALLVTHPTTAPGVLAAIAAGGIGGKLPDIDQMTNWVNRETVYDSIIDLLFIGAIIIVDYLVGNGICRYVTDNWGLRVWVGLAGLAILTIIGITSSHRSFTHSFVCLALFVASMFLFCFPIVIPFAVGYASHLVLDLFNH